MFQAPEIRNFFLLPVAPFPRVNCALTANTQNKVRKRIGAARNLMKHTARENM